MHCHVSIRPKITFNSIICENVWCSLTACVCFFSDCSLSLLYPCMPRCFVNFVHYFPIYAIQHMTHTHTHAHADIRAWNVYTDCCVRITRMAWIRDEWICKKFAGIKYAWFFDPNTHYQNNSLCALLLVLIYLLVVLLLLLSPLSNCFVLFCFDDVHIFFVCHYNSTHRQYNQP